MENILFLNNIKKYVVDIKYAKDDLSQVNPQLYEWLAIINDKSSYDDRLPQNSYKSNPSQQNNSDSGKEFNDPNGRYSKDDTIFDDFEDEVVFSEGGVSYEIKYQLFTEKDYYNNSLKLQKMNAVEELTGEEFSYDGTPLNKRVLRYFRELGNNIYSDVFGDVALNNSSVHDDLGHGKTKYKIASFKAVPAVIKKGVVIDRVY